MDEAITDGRLRKLHELSVAIGIETAADQVGEALLRGVLEVAQADAALVLVRGDGDTPGSDAQAGLTAAENRSLRELLDRLCDTKVLTGPLAVANVRAEPTLAPVPDGLGPVALFASPLGKGDGGQLGVVALMRRPPRLVFAEAEIRLIEMLLSHAATAIENARLQATLRERAERTEALNEIARALATTTDVAKVFPRVTGAMHRLIDFDLTVLVAVEVTGQGARVLAFEAVDDLPHLKLGMEFEVPPEFPELVRTRGPLQLTDLGKKSHPSWRHLVEAGSERLMVAPLLSGHQVPAVLVVASRGARGYGSRELSRLQAIADQMAPAIEGVRLQQALRESRALYETLLQAVPDPITVIDLAGRITYATERAVEQQGATAAEQLLGESYFDLFAPEYVELALENALRTIENGTSGPIECELLTRKDERLNSELSAALFSDANGVPRGFIAVTRDITERKKAEARVRSYQEKLRSLAAELSLAEERQRRHIAAELHDEISQTLVLVKLKLGALRSQSTGAMQTEHDELRGIVDQTIGRVQSLIWEISSPILSELGLEAAVRWLADKLSRSYGIAINFHDDVAEKPVAEDVRLVLFQAVRELLINVSKHAQTQAAHVFMRRAAEELEIEVTDEGIGFDPSDVTTIRSDAGGFGLFSIRERLGYLGGSVEVRSRPGAGTRVKLRAPLSRQQGSDLASLENAT